MPHLHTYRYIYIYMYIHIYIFYIYIYAYIVGCEVDPNTPQEAHDGPYGALGYLGRIL